MFDEAGLEYPPQEYGTPYVLDGEEVEWNFDTLREVAKRLTVDINGNDATSADFDPEQIEQYGYEPIFQDLRAIGSYFGSGRLVADDEVTAQVPDPWREAWTWHYENIWTDNITMPLALRDAPEFGNGNPFNARGPPWRSRTRGTPAAPMRSTRRATLSIPIGTSRSCRRTTATVTANFNADTFRIWGDTENPEEAFEVLEYLIGDASQDLLGIYGGMPARTADQDRSSPASTSAGRRASTGRSPGWHRVRRQPELRGLDAELPGDLRLDRHIRATRCGPMAASTSTRPSTTSRRSSRRSSTPADADE